MCVEAAALTSLTLPRVNSPLAAKFFPRVDFAQELELNND